MKKKMGVQKSRIQNIVISHAYIYLEEKNNNQKHRKKKKSNREFTILDYIGIIIVLAAFAICISYFVINILFYDWQLMKK